MAQLTSNEYKAVWKHKTPLNSDYLNILFEGMGEGLVTLPTFDIDGDNVIVHPFSALVIPWDGDSAQKLEQEMIKVVITSDITVSITRETYSGTDVGTRGIGLRIIKTDTDTVITIDAVSGGTDCTNYKGIFIGNCVFREGSGGTAAINYCTVNGADYSDLLLSRLGYDPSFWVSPVSPRRYSSREIKTSLWEIRYHNESMAQTTTDQTSLNYIKGAVPFLSIGGDTDAMARINTDTYVFDLYDSAHPTNFYSMAVALNKYINSRIFNLTLQTMFIHVRDTDNFTTGVIDNNENLIPMAVIVSDKTANHIANIYVDDIRAAKLFTNLTIGVSSNTLQID